MPRSRAYSLAHLTVPGMHPFDMIETAARVGFTHVGFRFTQVTPGGWAFPMHEDAALLRETRRRLDDSGIGVFDIEVARILPNTTAGDLEALVSASAELGAPHILAQIHDNNRERAAENFATLCDLAADYGLSVNLEFLPWTQNRSLCTAAAFVGLANRRNCGVLIDTLHFDRSSSSPEDLRAMPAQWFKYVQLCDASAERPNSVEAMIHTAREARLDPGEGGLDLLGIMRALPEDLPISLEVPNTEREGSLPCDVRLGRMLSRTKELMESVEIAEPV